MPKGLWAALTEARHAIEPSGDGAIAGNPGNRQHFAFRDGSLAVAPAAESPGWSWGMRLTGYGTPGQVEPVAPAELHANGTRLE
ncbi:MAG: hypothetical protein KDI88_17465, partial [Gammaproteobacteria bacterium]|nr:hypothetical protein [Gammaproteobacteria bacterium]